MTQPPYVWTPPIGAQRARHTRRTVITVITVLAVLVVFLAAMAGYLVWHAQDAAASVTLEPTNSATADSFMPAHGPDASVATPPGNGGGTVAGSTPGLFGGTSDNSTCDQAQMSEFLAAHPDKAEAWAEAEGVGRSDIPEYVRQLTPVLLRADTSITNHGYRDGRLTAYPAVLEAGTAVLVDGYGTPRVKCYCGNPLSAPPQQQPRHFSGTAWRHFAPVTVVVVRPAPVVVQNLTVINVQNNTVVNVHVAPWRWGPPPGWTGSPSSSSSSTSTSATDTSSVSPYSDPYGQRAGSPGTGCDPATNVPGAVTTTTGTCPTTSTTTPTTTTTTPTTTTTTTTTTTEPTTTTTTTSGSVN
ncbi:DUF6777 domain-containing protein [Actinomycetospora sp.]|uniref:DUF6777 domain-containing protein n=1 Tax=Actinomycetospora sp. TaxID=1872135 RepID=UPI002F42C94B